MEHKHAFGQYFTTSDELKNKLTEFILNKPNLILEPSIGRGDLVDHVSAKYPDIKFDMYEIDASIEFLESIDMSAINFGDFMEMPLHTKYSTIIGNPPYVKLKTGNLYIDFTNKCYEALDDNGELIFIVPSDFLKLTSACKLLNKMMTHGTFTHIYHPHNEKLFENASIDVIIFRYCKNSTLKKKVLYNDVKMYVTNASGLITFHKKKPQHTQLLSDLFEVYVGIVSGKDDVYKNELGNISVINGKDKIERYILINEYPSGNTDIDEYLFSHKETLMGRRIRKFNESNRHD